MLAAVALVGLSACTSTPSAKTVGEEIIEALDAPQAVKDCMAERLDAYTNDDLANIAKGNVNFTSTNSSIPVTPELQAFIDDLAECRDGGAATGNTATGGTATESTATESTATDAPATDASAPSTTAG